MPRANASVSTAPDGPVTASEFAAALDRLGPFEANPVAAVAVSGGADSLALLRLAAAWARARGGRAVALTVDHRLRPESAAEARQVARWAAALQVAHHVLVWTGDKPRAGLQAAARAARYDLLSRWCEAAGVLHLLLGHHRDDQAETVAMREARGTGPDGLSGMAAIVETPALRLLRPLLAFSHARLVETLTAAGQAWLEDPSNTNPAFARARTRAALGGAETAGFLATAGDAAAQRSARDGRTAALLARAAAIYPEGWVRLDPGVLLAAPEAPRALAQVIQAVGGGAYAPRRERLDRLFAGLPGLKSARTLGGCRIVPRRGALLIVREDRLAREVLPLSPAAASQTLRWDNRFRLVLRVLRPELRLARLGEGWAEIAARAPALRESPIPAPARPGLPAVWDLDGVVSVPHLCYGRQAEQAVSVRVVSVSFEPSRPVAGPRFPVC